MDQVQTILALVVPVLKDLRGSRRRMNNKMKKGILDIDQLGYKLLHAAKRFLIMHMNRQAMSASVDIPFVIVTLAFPEAWTLLLLPVIVYI